MRDGVLSKKWAVVGAVAIVFIVLVAYLAISNNGGVKVVTQEDRIASIPGTAVKMTPEADLHKPVMHSSLWQQPVLMPGPVNTAGAEDSPFITQNGTWFFFFFTPDVTVPAEKQLLDGVTGIWWTQLLDGVWTPPEKIILNDDVSLEGAECVIGDKMWFASIRTGNLGEIDVYTAEYREGKWGNVQNAGQQLNVQYDIGEFHMLDAGAKMYFHSGKWGANETMDIWETHLSGGSWTTPVEAEGVNSGMDDGFPYVTADGNEMWFTRYTHLEGFDGPAIYRSIKQLNGSWGAPEEMVSDFAGEPTMDAAGNLYFVHHYYSADKQMIEADIYLCKKV